MDGASWEDLNLRKSIKTSSALLIRRPKNGERIAIYVRADIRLHTELILSVQVDVVETLKKKELRAATGSRERYCPWDSSSSYY